MLSRVGAPAGRRLPFGPGTTPVSGSLQPALASSSILSRSANRSPCGSPARTTGRLVGVSTFRFISPRGGRCLLSAGELWRSRRVAVLGPYRLPHLLVQAYQLVWLARIDGRSTQVHVCSPCPLSSPHPVLSYQEGPTLSRFRTPRVAHASAHCQGRSLFRPLDSPGDTGGPLFSEDT